MYLTALPTISGTATDNPGGTTYNSPSGISTSSVQVAVRLVGGSWWNGTAQNFNGSDPDYTAFTVVNATTTNPNAWSVTVPAGLQNALATGNSYRLISRAMDNAGNAEFGPLNGNVPAGVGVSVLYDSAPAVSSITYPNDGGAYRGVSLTSGTATDTLTGRE